VLGRGSRPVTLDLTDGGGWLASEQFGLLFHVNGPSGVADAAVALPGAAGHQLAVLTDITDPARAHAATTTAQPAPVASAAGQEAPANLTTPGAGPDAPSALAGSAGVDDLPGDPATTFAGKAVIVVDAVTGTVRRVDPALLEIVATVTYPQGTVVSAVGGDAYAVDAAGGLVTRIDPRTLGELGSPLTFPRGLGTVAQTADGTLWVPVPSTGTVVPVRSGTPGTPVAVAPAGNRIDTVVIAGSPVVVDRTAGTVTRVAAAGAEATIRLPAAAAGADGARELLMPARTGGQETSSQETEGQASGGQVVALVEPSTGRLLLADLASGQVTSTALPAIGDAGVDLAALAGANGARTGSSSGSGGSGAAAAAGGRRLGEPVWHDGHVYVPDSDAGVVWAYDPVSGRFAAPVSVAPAGGAARITATVQDGQLWINDEAGPNVVLVDGTIPRTIVKFGASLPGGERTGTPRPLPPGQTPGARPDQPSGPAGAGAGGREQIWPGAGRPGADGREGRRGDGRDGDGRGGGDNHGGDGNHGGGTGGNGGNGGGDRPGGPGGGQPTATGGPQPQQPPSTPGHSTDPRPTASQTATQPRPEPTATAQPEPTVNPGQPGTGETVLADGHGTDGHGTGQDGAGGSGAGQGSTGQGSSRPAAGGQSTGPGSAADGGDVPTDSAGSPPTTRPAATPAPASTTAAGSPGRTTPPAPPTATPGHAPTSPSAGSPLPPGFWLLTDGGSVLARGNAGSVGAGGAEPAAVALAPTATGRGYWLVDGSGAGHPVGDAAALAANAGAGTVVAAAASPTGGGYWTVTAAGVVAAHGTLPGYGSLAVAPAAPVIGIAASPTGGGYWLVDAAGGVYPFGDAESIAAGVAPGAEASGSARTVGIAASPTGSGYWTVTAAGTVTAHGAAGRYGSSTTPSAAIVGIATTPSGRGYWLVDAAGGVSSFGDAAALSGSVPAGTRVVAVAAAP